MGCSGHALSSRAKVSKSYKPNVPKENNLELFCFLPNLGRRKIKIDIGNGNVRYYGHNPGGDNSNATLN
jgi:hypothetical protein